MTVSLKLKTTLVVDLKKISETVPMVAFIVSGVSDKRLLKVSAKSVVRSARTSSKTTKTTQKFSWWYFFLEIGWSDRADFLHAVLI